jgi:hypothetical protein
MSLGFVRSPRRNSVSPRPRVPFVLPRDGLILMKRDSDRPIDRDDIERLGRD